MLVWRKRTPSIERGGELELERLLLGYIRPLPFTGINPDQNWFDDFDDILGVRIFIAGFGHSFC